MAVNLCKSATSLFGRLSADRRGATAVAFAAGAAGLFGLVGLATEGGTWYLEKRHGQNAADAAAMAGALALSNGQNVAANVVNSITGYNSGVTITTGTFAAGSYTATGAASANAVQAVVTTSSSPLFSRLFVSGPITIRESAVAMLAATGPVCMLAGAGGLSFGGASGITATGCSLVSNKTGSSGITGASAAHVGANASLVSAGGCSGCTGLNTSPLTYQPQTPAPAALTTIEGLTLPNKTGTQCNKSTSTPVAYNSTTPPAINCNTFKMIGSSTVNLTPGTYVFFDASIQLNNGILECTTCTGVGTSGVTIIMTGTSPSSVGSIGENGNPTIQLAAPATNSFNSAFNGVLFYTDQKAALGNSVKLTGDSASTFSGAMYFPSSAITFSGNSGGTAPTCSEIVGYSVTLTGSSQVNVSGCPTGAISHTQIVRLAM
jgi:Flp pilus assembly protein TadG